MEVGFAEMAEALQDLARWERHRIQLTCDLANRGHAFPPSSMEIGGWVERLARLEAAAGLIATLIPHEQPVLVLAGVNGPEGARVYVSERGRKCVGTPRSLDNPGQPAPPLIG